MSSAFMFAPTNGKLMLSSEVQIPNAPSPISVTVRGMSIAFKPEQL